MGSMLAARRRIAPPDGRASANARVDRFSDARFESPAIHIADPKIVNLEPSEDEAQKY